MNEKTKDNFKVYMKSDPTLAKEYEKRVYPSNSKPQIIWL